MSHHPERTARNVRPVNQPPSYHIVKEIMPIPSVCMVVVALLLYELWRIGRGIWIGRESACWEIGVWNCFFVLSAVLSSSRGEAFANAVPFVVYATIVFIVAFLMTHLPRMRRWYVFRRRRQYRPESLV